MSELRPDDLPETLGDARRALIVDLNQFWLRIPDYRFGQMLREATAISGRSRLTGLTDDAVREGLPAARDLYPERPPPMGRFWDTETQGQGSFLKGRPRDPARIPRVLKAFAEAWARHPHLSIGQLIEFALRRAGLVDNNGVIPWLGIEDGPVRRILQALADESETRPQSTPAPIPPQTVASHASEMDELTKAMRDSHGGIIVDPDRFHDWVVRHGGLTFSRA